ncbi:MAG: transketolase C-terminal domain-containing protein, partial [Planctomycetota bacterium]
NVLRTGDDVAIIACGALVAHALTAADILQKEGILASVVNMHTLKPLDDKTLLEVAKRTKAVVTAEQHVLDGGLGSAVASVLSRNYPLPVEMIGIDNRFGQSGDPDVLFKEYHLLPEDIVIAAKRAIGRKQL